MRKGEELEEAERDRVRRSWGRGTVGGVEEVNNDDRG